MYFLCQTFVSSFQNILGESGIIIVNFTLFIIVLMLCIKKMYLDCATKNPKIDGDHAQETIDIDSSAIFC